MIPDTPPGVDIAEDLRVMFRSVSTMARVLHPLVAAQDITPIDDVFAALLVLRSRIDVALDSMEGGQR